MTVEKGIYERHLQTAIQIIIIAILMWFGNKTILTSDTVIRLELQIVSLNEKIVELQAVIATTKNSRYTEADALNDQRVRELQEQMQANRISQLEDKVKEIRDYLTDETNWKREMTNE